MNNTQNFAKLRELFKSNFEIIKETENFIVIPSEGSIVPGWVLILPKNFFLNFSILPSNLYAELNCLINDVSIVVIEKFGIAPTIFEHGPNRKNSCLGCSIDYAHLHIVPLNFSLLNESFNLDPKIIWHKVSNINDLPQLVKNIEYLYIKTPEKLHFISTKFNKTNQFFRKVIANYKNCPEKFNWRQYAFQKNIDESIYRYLSTK